MKTKTQHAFRYQDCAFLKRNDYVEVYKSYDHNWPRFIGVLFNAERRETPYELYQRAKNELPEFLGE
jgi:hypothetical protein